MKTANGILLPLFLLTAGCPTAFGLAEERIGPMPDAHAQPDWADGLIVPLRNPSRVYSRWVNGNETFYFDAAPDQLTSLITDFSNIRLRDHVVRLVAGEPFVNSFKGTAFRYNASLHVLSGIALWHAKSTTAKADTFEPTLTIQIATDADRKLLEHFTWPKHVVINNQVPGWNLTSNAQKPVRKIMYALLEFEDGQPASDFESGMSTTITLWDERNSVGINLGKVGNDGRFSAPFSLDEIKLMKSGEAWLTTTVGNYLTAAVADHPRLPVNNLSLDAASVLPTVVARSAEYHGQILFEDGSPPILDPEPWPGAEIHLSFPFAGMARPDKSGRFRIALTESQFEELISRPVSKNVYVPLYGTLGRSRALHAYPAKLLKTKISDVQAFRIPHPNPKSRK